MLTVDHSPLDDRIFYKEALSLKKAGHQVSIVCTANADGKIADMGGQSINQGKGLQFEVNGIQIYGVVRPDSFTQKLLHKFFLGSYVSDFVQTASNIKADVYHAHEPVSYYLGLQLQKKQKAKLVFDMHESWQGGTPKERWIKKFHLHKLEYLITANEITRGHLLSQHPQMKATVIYNYFLADMYDSPLNEEKCKKPVIVHEGLIPFNRGLKDIVEAIRILKEKHPDVLLRIVGQAKGAEKKYLDSKIKEYGLASNIQLTGWVQMEEVGQHLEDCAIGLITKTYTRNNLLGGPAIKVFNYLAHGIAIVDVGFAESIRFMDEAQSGISCERSSQAIAEAIDTYLSKPSLLEEDCRKAYAYREQIQWKHSANKLLSFYNTHILSDNKLTFHSGTY